MKILPHIPSSSVSVDQSEQCLLRKFADIFGNKLLCLRNAVLKKNPPKSNKL